MRGSLILFGEASVVQAAKEFAVQSNQERNPQTTAQVSQFSRTQCGKTFERFLVRGR